MYSDEADAVWCMCLKCAGVWCYMGVDVDVSEPVCALNVFACACVVWNVGCVDVCVESETERESLQRRRRRRRKVYSKLTQ